LFIHFIHFSSMVKSLALLAGVAIGAEGVRVSRRAAEDMDVAKTIAGVPVLNYQTAYKGRSMGPGEKEHWVVVAREGVDDSLLEQMCESSGACERVGNPSQGGVPYFEVHASEEQLEKVLSMAPGELDFIEPDGMVYLIPEQGVETMPMAASWGLDKIGVPSRPRNGAGVNIYVLDTGIRSSHQDFGGRASGAIDLTSNTLRECAAGDANCAGDAQGHGTHCAGTAGGNTYGVASGAKLFAGKVLSDSGSGSWSWSYDALNWMATKSRRPAVASMSLGGSGTQSAMRTAVDAAVNAGVTVVVAGGNSNSDSCFFSPAFVPSAITVGSTTSTNFRSSFSNYGSCTNIWAPGSDITSASHRSDTGSATFSGTSMACPHVSGASALVLQANPGWKSNQVLSDMLSKASKGKIQDLKNGDTNALLWVGAGAAP